jgi:hypothetical protein
MSLIPYVPTSECVYTHYDYVEWLPNINIVWGNPVYSIILSYFIGIYAGIFLSIDYVHKYTYIMHDLMDSDNEKQDDKESDENDDESDEDKDDEDKDDEDQDDESDDDDQDDEDYTEEDLKQDEEHDEKQEEEDDNEFTKMEIRDAIDKLYLKTEEWDNFISTKSIYLRLQKVYPSITKFMVKEAMHLKPKYITGTQHNTKGYRFISAV